MLDRQKVEAVLMLRFPGAGPAQIAAAANAIMGMSGEREQVARHEPDDVPGALDRFNECQCPLCREPR